MTAELRSPDLDWLAHAIETHYRSQGYTVSKDHALWDGAPRLAYRARRGSEDLLLEMRRKPDLPHYLEPFLREAINREEPVGLCVVVAARGNDDQEPTGLSLRNLQRMRELGVGLIEFGPTGPHVVERPVSFSLRVAVPARLRRYTEIIDIARKFNRGDALDALRDLVVHVEQLVLEVTDRAARRGVVNITPPEAANLDLSNVIDMLATPTYRGRPQHRIITPDQRADLHSFRTARNMAQHAPRTRAERARLDRQLKERMVTGFRLCEELRAVRVPRVRTA